MENDKYYIVGLGDTRTLVHEIIHFMQIIYYTRPLLVNVQITFTFYDVNNYRVINTVRVII